MSDMQDKTSSAHSDQELIDALRDTRCEAAFRELYRRHTPRLLRLIMRILGGADAEDVVQDTWIRAVEHLSSFRGEAQFRTWLTRIGVRLSQDHLRKRKHAHLRLETAMEPASRDMPIAERIDLERLFARLPEGYRSILLLHDLEGYTHAEIGGMLGIAEGTSKSQLHDARRLAQEIFDGRTLPKVRRAPTANA